MEWVEQEVEDEETKLMKRDSWAVKVKRRG